MAYKASGSQPLNKNNLQKFDAALYEKTPLSNLIVYSVHYLHEQEARTTMEDIVFACFLLFPKKFALKQYPKWPDSALVGRRLSDYKSKGLISGNSDLGFTVTFKGTRLVRKVAKGLGVVIAKREKAKRTYLTVKKKAGKPRPVQKVEAATPPVLTKKAQVKKPQPAPKTIPQVLKRKVRAAKSVQPVKKVKAIQGTKIIPRTPTKKVRPAKQVWKVQPPQPKVRAKKQQVKQPVIKEKAPTPVKKVRPVQQKLPFSIVVEKARPQPPAKVVPPVQMVVTREVKVRAGKFVRVIEKSDAYKHYQKNGKYSKISEFDFRSLLLCTMESSPETLARNVNLYKGYAGIHNRQDLIAFLNFCEEYFSSLLTPTPKRAGR